MNGTEMILVAVVSVAIFAGIGLSMGYDRYQTKALGEAAQRSGCSFEADATIWVRTGPYSLPLFRRGRSQTPRWLVQPGQDRDLSVFEHRYEDGGRKSKYTTRITVFAIRRSGKWPTFQLRPEGIVDRVGQAMFSTRDFDFPEHPAFSKRYLLRGPQESAVRSLFASNVIAFFENESGWFVEADNLWLIAYQVKLRMKPGNLADILDRGRRLREIFRD